MNQIRSRLKQNALNRNQNILVNKSMSNMRHGSIEDSNHQLLLASRVTGAQQNTIKECTNSSSKSSNTNKFQMSGRLLKSKGEEDEALLMKLDEEDEYLRDGLDDEDELGDLLNEDELGLSYLDEHLNEEFGQRCGGFLASQLLDIDIDNEGEFGSEFEDPFTSSRQKILEDILREGEEKDNSIKKGRGLFSEETFWDKEMHQRKIQ